MKSTIRPDIPGVRDGDQWGGQVLFYVCAGCNRPRRYLYPWEMIDGRLVHDLSLRCAQCARLRYPCQQRRPLDQVRDDLAVELRHRIEALAEIRRDEAGLRIEQWRR